MNTVDFSVKTPCPEVSEMLQKLAFKVGYTWMAFHDGTVKHTEMKALKFRDSCITYYLSTPDSDVVCVSLEDAVALLSPKLNTAQLGEYTAKFNPGQDVKVGCQIITAEQISNFIKLWSKGN